MGPVEVACVRTSIVRIGNSRGIRIPKALLDQCNLGSTVELEVQDGSLVVRPAERPRLGWDEAFRRMAAQGDDELLDRESIGQTDWDATEWEW
jgi:antitoxin MazE